MGYIDADTHVIEDEHTWDFFDPGETQFRPLMSDGYWTIHVVMPYPGPGMTQWMTEANFLHAGIMPVPGAFYAVLRGELAKRFPRLRWAFLEAGASWLPFVLQETFRADETGALRSFKDWRKAAALAFEEQQLFVSAQMDDDLPYLLQFTGSGHLVHGTDFGHLDLGSDPNGLHLVANRKDVDPEVTAKIVDDNARRLYGIDPGFRPAPPPSVDGFALPPGLAGAH